MRTENEVTIAAGAHARLEYSKDIRDAGNKLAYIAGFKAGAEYCGVDMNNGVKYQPTEPPKTKHLASGGDKQMSIRAQIAAMMMQGIYAGAGGSDYDPHIVAGTAVRCADTLIEELNK